MSLNNCQLTGTIQQCGLQTAVYQFSDTDGDIAQATITVTVPCPPDPTPVPPQPTAVPPTPVSTEDNSAQNAPVQTIVYTEPQILATLLEIATAQGLPLSADSSTVALQNGFVTIRSTTLFFGQEIVSEFLIRFILSNDQPVAIVDSSIVNNEPLPAEVTSVLAAEITNGISAELRDETNYSVVESIVIANGLLTVSYR